MDRRGEAGPSRPRRPYLEWARRDDAEGLVVRVFGTSIRDTLFPMTAMHTTKLPAGVASVENVCEVERFATPGADPSAPPDLLIEVPHGATRRRHFSAIRRLLSGDLPPDLEDFFFVNTDVGSAEVARKVAERVVRPAAAAGLEAPPRTVLVLRCLIPRTFIDANRVLEGDSSAEMTPPVPEYVRERRDVELLTSLYARYHAVADRAYELVCGAGGLAFVPHTYAPKAISVDSFDEGIGKALRRAYEPERYQTWPTRPAVDLLTATPDGVELAPRQLIAAIRRGYAKVGISAAENASYHLHPATMAYRYSTRYPGQVLCLEIARDLLADPFSPFEEMRIGAHKVAAMSAPIAAAFVEELGRC